MRAIFRARYKCSVIFRGNLVILHSHFSWQAQNLVMLERDFSWQPQHLVMLECLFSWPAQHLVKFG